MLLKESLEECVADVRADVPTLVRDARRDGLARRRTVRALSAVGTAAAVAALAGAAWLVVPGGGDAGLEVATSPSASTDQLSGRTGPATGRGMAAALLSEVERVTGAALAPPAAFRGHAGPVGPAGSEAEPMATLVLTTDATGADQDRVQIQIQPLNGEVSGQVGPPPYTCAGYPDDCAVAELPDGDVLRTYAVDDDGRHDLTAEVISPARSMRLVLTASTTTRGSLLTADQLVDIATQPWWNRDTLPVEFLEGAGDLPSFSDACVDERLGPDHGATTCR